MARQRTAKQIIALLHSLGLADVEIVEEDKADAAYDQDADIKEIDGSREPIISQKIKGALEQDVHKSVSGKTLSAHRAALVEATGISADLIKDLNGKEATKAALAHYAKTLGVDKETAATQLQEVMGNHTKEIERVKGEKDKEIETLRVELSSFGINNVLAGMYSDTTKFPKGVKPEILQGDFYSDLQRRFDIKLNADKKGITLYKKGTNEIALNAQGTLPIDLAAEQKNFHMERGQWNEDNRGQNPADTLKDKHTAPVKVGNEVLSASAANDRALMEFVGSAG